MNDELSDYLISELGFEAVKSRPGLDRAITAFLGQHFLQKKPIQEQAIEIIYNGTDTLLISPTASGKTEAALIPISARLLINPEQVALYLAPTRALLNDLFRRLEGPLHQLGLEIRIRHGDISLSDKSTSVRVLLTTPESLDVLLSGNHSLLKKVSYLILDEVHQLYGNPRGDQLVFLLQRLEKRAKRRIQRVALSATVGNPEDMSRWLCPQREPAQTIIALGKREIVGQFHWLSTMSQLRDLVKEGRSNKVLCFVNSRRSCDDVYLILKDLEPYQSYIHYSTLTKEQRGFVERGFKTSQMAICVATSTLELGIDIGSIEKVILVEPSLSVMSFLQRIGRGGRRGPNTEVTLLSKNSLELLQNLALLNLAEKDHVESEVVGHPYSILVQQVFSILAGKRNLLIHPDELDELFGVFGWFDRENIITMLEKLVDKDFLRREPSRHVYGVGRNLEDLIEKYEIFTNITGSEVGIPVFHEGRLLANLPLRPHQIKRGNVVLYAGRFWRIVSISDAGLAVRTNPPVSDPIRPVWGSRGIFNMSLLLAQGIRDLLTHHPRFDNHNLDARCSGELDELYSKTNQLTNSGDAVWFEHSKGKHIYYTFVGALGNQILELIFEKNGFICKPINKAEGIALSSDVPLDFNVIPKDPETIVSLINTSWRHMANYATTGPFFDNLPTPLKRDEILSRIINISLVNTISHLHEIPLTPINLKLFE